VTKRGEGGELEGRAIELERQCRVLLGENDLLRTLLREAVDLLLAGAPRDGMRVFVDKLERFL
jgi:hypothetical protein